MGKVIVVIAALILLFGVFSDNIIDGINDWRTDETTENFLTTTGAGQTSANLTLSYDLFQAALAEVTSITSSNVTDTPVGTAYVGDDKQLTVGGLAASATRTLTVDYTSETEDAEMRLIGPFLGVLVLGGAVFYIFWQAKRKGG